MKSNLLQVAFKIHNLSRVKSHHLTWCWENIRSQRKAFFDVHRGNIWSCGVDIYYFINLICCWSVVIVLVESIWFFLAKRSKWQPSHAHTVTPIRTILITFDPKGVKSTSFDNFWSGRSEDCTSKFWRSSDKYPRRSSKKYIFHISQFCEFFFLRK